MTDIIERLKSWDRCYPGNINIEDAVDEAADEIERLRAENDKLRAILQALINDIEDYEHINNITPKFSKLCCVESIRNAREILKK